jgi:peptide/nickel transport system substrate-binding protein
MHITLAPTWFDPAETGALITPYLCLYALHDALVKPMPDQQMAPCLATAWRESDDGLTYDFELRQGVKFHNGDPFTAEDVQFSFARYKGAGATELKKQVKALEMVHAHHIRFVLHEPWPDFLTFYATPATGAGWIVPKAYTEKIGNEAFKNQPVGLGPYRFVSYKPGLELVLEASPDYWRKPPVVKRLVFKSVPEATTRLAMLKKQEADVTYAIYGTLGEEVQRDTTLKLEPTLAGTEWGIFVDMDDPTSPWHDKRVRLAANHAVNRQILNEAETLGYSKLLGGIIPETYAFALPLEPYAYDPNKAKALLTEAGYPQGFDAGEFSCDAVYAGVIEGVVNDLAGVGIRAKVQPRERAVTQAAQREKRVKNLTRMGSGAPGNAATRVEAFMTSTGIQSYLKDPEIDQWFAQQSRERGDCSICAGFALDWAGLFGLYWGGTRICEEEPIMFGPGEYRPDPTEGLTRMEDLPAPKIMFRQRNATRHLCPHGGHRASREKPKQRRLHDLGDLSTGQPQDLQIT